MAIDQEQVRDRDRAVEPTTEEEMRQSRVGELKQHNAPITLAEYDPEWPRQFEAIAAKIRGAIGENAVVLEHAGSTSVPGLCAKPIIDIVLAVPDSSDESTYVPQLEAVGFRLNIREPEWFEHRVLKYNEQEVNLHTFTVGCSEIDRMLRFRDWLRAHPEDRDLYANAKRELSSRTWQYVQHYADAKTTVVNEIVARAEAGMA